MLIIVCVGMVHRSQISSFLVVLFLFLMVLGIVVSFIGGVLLTGARDLCHATSLRNPDIVMPSDGSGASRRGSGSDPSALPTDQHSLLHHKDPV
jgi:hypothetical protein